MTSNTKVKVWAEAKGDVTKTESGAVSIAIGVSGAGTDQQATGEVLGTVEASIGAGARR